MGLLVIAHPSIDLKNVKTIEGEYNRNDGTFSGCTSLVLIRFGNVEFIGDFAFQGCSSLTSIDLKNVKFIGGNAFGGCKIIDEIRTFESEAPYISYSSFENSVYDHAKLYVPQGSKQNYLKDPVWSKFLNIIEFDVNVQHIYLTIQQAQSGKVDLKAEKGKTYYLKISPSGNWRINTVTFNGTDVTSQLDGNNGFTTPAITESSTLNVSFESTNAAITDVMSDRISVRADNDQIYVEGISAGTPISIYTQDGAMVASQIANGNNVVISVQPGNVYIVKTSGRTFKIAI